MELKEHDILCACALRFDGYKYAATRGVDLCELTEAYVIRLKPHEWILDNLAVFFSLQRWLHKWGGEYEPETSRNNIAFRELFLELCQADIPEEFRHEECWKRWRQEFLPRQEECVEVVRDSYRRLLRNARQEYAERMAAYKADLDKRYWEYQRTQFPKWQDFFEQPRTERIRPPVFRADQAWRNVLFRPGATREETDSVLSWLPEDDRHRWFRSMNSSQALAQSVFGNLAVHDCLDILAELRDDGGLPLLGDALPAANNFYMEFKVNYLGEPRPTSLDCYFAGGYRVAMECKFTEAEVGTCSRPRLPTRSPGRCDGEYTKKPPKSGRCPLTARGVRYWRYVPLLFCWDAERDLVPCPLRANYQLVRNILAVGVSPDGSVSPANGHAVVIYDERNPAFQEDGKGDLSFRETRLALREPRTLRTCSWQRIVKAMRGNEILPWLTEQLAMKYGL